MKYRIYFYSFDYSKFADTLIDAERIGKESGFLYKITEVTA
tara:strand:+ start:841 stop:963 length:123 start_codon:yes stop_codon:yes gene_type:complete